jgi:hypothetical protein
MYPAGALPDRQKGSFLRLLCRNVIRHFDWHFETTQGDEVSARKAVPTKLRVGREDEPIVHPQNNSAVVRVPEPMRGRVAGILATSGKPVKIFLALMALSVFFDLVTAACCSHRV